MGKYTARHDGGNMIFVLRDGRKVVPALMGNVPHEEDVLNGRHPLKNEDGEVVVEVEHIAGIKCKGWLLSNNKNLFGDPLLVTFDLSEVTDIIGSYIFPPIK